MDGPFDSQDLVVFPPDVYKLAVYSLLELILLEQKFAVVQRLIFFNFTVVKLMLVFLANSQFFVLLQKYLAFSFELFKIFEQRFVHISHAINHNHDKDVVRTHSRPDQLVNVVGHTLERILQVFLALSAHTDTNTNLHAIMLGFFWLELAGFSDVSFLNFLAGHT